MNSQLKLLSPNGHNTSTLINFVSGGIAGSIATVVSYPFDLLRTRYAIQSNNQKVYTTLFKAVPKIYGEEGVRGFYKGLLSSIIQIFPYMGLMFGSFTFMKDKIKKVFRT